MINIDGLYQQLLGRGVDASGASFYSGMGEDQVRAALMASPEYASRQAAQQTQANKPQAAVGGFNNPAGYIPQSLLNSLETDLQGALSGNFTPAKDPWQGYASQATTGPAPGSPEWNSSQGWKDVLTTAVQAAGSAPQTKPGGSLTGSTGGLGALGGQDMSALMQQMQSQYLTGMQSMMDTFGKSLGAIQQNPGGQGATYNPTGVGGSFSNVQSPVYRPNGETDGNRKPVNGFGGMFGSGAGGPFRSTF